MNLNKLKKYIALTTVIILVLLYMITFFFAISNSPNSGKWFLASFFATVTLPIIVWVILLLARRK